MSAAYWVTGNTLDVLRKMPDASIDVAITSPPFLALRSYLPDDDPAKVHEIGSEPTPGEFIDTLLDITEELRRVVAPHGSIAVELGDTYSGSGGAGGDYSEGGLRDGQQAFSGSAAKRRRDGITDGGRPPRSNRPRSEAIADGRTSRPPRRRSPGPDPRYKQRGEQSMGTGAGGDWPNDKSLTMIPELYRIALAYGVNPLTGRETPRWRCRNVVRWTRPNPPVGALGDKFRPGTSEMVIATGVDEAGRTRYFDLDAVRHEPEHGYTSTRQALNTRPIPGQPQRMTNPLNADGERIECNPAGAPPLDWWLPTDEEAALWADWEDQWLEQMWEIPTKGYKGSHYATFPPALVVRPIDAMCPLKVCRTCGEPSRRIAEVEHEANRTTNGPQSNDRKHQEGGSAGYDVRAERRSTTVGWTDCGHDNWRTGRVLDPFGGSGTTLAVATGHGRDAIGIDLDARNVHLAAERIGPMFFHHLDVEQLAEVLG